MFKLRMTWKDIFTIEKLRNLDDSARDLDPNWPRITEAETAPSTVHINPNFLYVSRGYNSHLNWDHLKIKK